MARFLIVLDVDSTLIENEVIELLAEEAGSLQKVAAVTERAMNGELDFAESLHERVATLKGLPLTAVAKVRHRVTVTTGAAELVSGVHAAGGVVCVVSGGFHEILDPIARELGLDDWRANRLEVSNEALTGSVRGPIIDAAAKADALREWAAQYGIPLRQTVAIGDGANDLAMMGASALSIGFDPKDAVRRAADVVLNVRDLSHVLFTLGLQP